MPVLCIRTPLSICKQHVRDMYLFNLVSMQLPTRGGYKRPGDNTQAYRTPFLWLTHMLRGKYNNNKLTVRRIT